MRVFRFIRTLHSWLGLLILPWIILFGFSGFYFNHQQAVLNMLPSGAYDETALSEAMLDAPMSAAQALAVVEDHFPDLVITDAKQTTYHGFRAYQFLGERAQVIVAADTGHFYHKTRLTRTTFAPDGTRLHRKIYWGRFLSTFHNLGWVDTRFSTILADISAWALIIFGFSGLFIWGFPRHKRYLRALGGLWPK